MMAFSPNCAPAITGPDEELAVQVVEVTHQPHRVEQLGTEGQHQLAQVLRSLGTQDLQALVQLEGVPHRVAEVESASRAGLSLIQCNNL